MGEIETDADLRGMVDEIAPIIVIEACGGSPVVDLIGMIHDEIEVAEILIVVVVNHVENSLLWAVVTVGVGRIEIQGFDALQMRRPRILAGIYRVYLIGLCVFRFGPIIFNYKFFSYVTFIQSLRFLFFYIFL